MKRILLIILILLFSMSVNAKVIDRIVAIVNDDVITLSELNEMTRYLTHQNNVSLEVKRKVLDDLINSRLALQQAEKMGIKVEDKEIEATIKGMLQQNGMTLEDLKKDLSQNGISFPEYKKWLKEQIVKSKLLALEVQGKVTVTDEEIKQYYQSYKDKYKGFTKYHLRHILLMAPQGDEGSQLEELKNKILELLKQGIPFSEVAKKYSQAPTAPEGGDLGWIKEKDLAPEIKSALKDLKPGQFSAWINTEAGYQIIQLVEKKHTPDKSLSAVKDEIYQVLYKKKMEQRYKNWLQQLRKQAYIQILL